MNFTVEKAYILLGNKFENLEVLGKTILLRCEEALCKVARKVVKINSIEELPKTGKLMIVPSIEVFYINYFNEMGEFASENENFVFGEDSYYGDVTEYQNRSSMPRYDAQEVDCGYAYDSHGVAWLFNVVCLQNQWKHMDNDVIIFRPETVQIEDDVKIAPGVQIFANVTLKGNTVIEEGCIIYEGTELKNASIRKNVVLRNAKINDSEIGEGTTVGPFAFIRDGAKVGKNCRLGDYVEIKKSILGDGVKMAHLAYVGDAEVGARTNVGCGSIFVNYNGKIKQRTVVGSDCFIGSNVNLIAPLTIGDNAYIAAGSTVTKNIGTGEFCVAREREYIKNDWERK